MHKIFFIAILATCLVACAGHQKKILVYASNTIQVDNTQKNISVDEGTTHNEKELDFSGSGTVTLNAQSPSGKFTLEATDDGLYIANLKPDTVVGSYQHTGTQVTDNITLDQVKQKIDSLQQLIAGTNISAANRNYFIPPGKIVHITDKVNAKVFGPYTSIPASFDAGSVPEIYKFYTTEEVREIISKLNTMLK